MTSSGSDRPRVTSRDVAELAGVDRSSVSLVVNDPDTKRVGADAKRRIHDAVETLGYVPHTAARQLRLGASRFVVMSFPSWPLGPTFDRFIEGAAEAAEEAGLVFLMHGSARSNGPSAAAAWAELRPRVFIGERARIDAAGVDLVRRSGADRILLLGDDDADVVPGATLVRTHLTEPGRIAAEHLMGCGYERFAVIVPSDPRLAFIADARVEGFVERMSASAAAVSVFRVDETDGDLRAALSAVEALGPSVGVFVYSDRYAIPLLAAARERGMDVPGRLGVVGVDNTLPALSTVPPLTSVWYDPKAFGRALVGHGVGADDRDPPSPGYVLEARQSTVRPPS